MEEIKESVHTRKPIERKAVCPVSQFLLYFLYFNCFIYRKF